MPRTPGGGRHLGHGGAQGLQQGQGFRTERPLPRVNEPAGSVKIRVETIAHYLERYAGTIIGGKKAAMAPGCPLLRVS